MPLWYKAVAGLLKAHFISIFTTSHVIAATNVVEGEVEDMSLDFTSLTILNTGADEKTSPLKHFLHSLKNQVHIYFRAWYVHWKLSLVGYLVPCLLGWILKIICFCLLIIARQSVRTAGGTLGWFLFYWNSEFHDGHVCLQVVSFCSLLSELFSFLLSSKSENENSSETSEQNKTTCRYAQDKKIKTSE